jgi:hypothetical protein
MGRLSGPESLRTPRFDRRQVYDRDLWAVQLLDTSGRSRRYDAEFYRSNEAQTHRIKAWVNRELLALRPLVAPNIRLDTSHRERIYMLIVRFNIISAEFHDQLLPILGQYTVHFMHEFFVFARCPYDLPGYDMHVRYDSKDRAMAW